jgi:hypothetical protein
MNSLKIWIFTLITLGTTLFIQNQVNGYTCTLKNESYATIVVEFYRYTRPSSGNITVMLVKPDNGMPEHAPLFFLAQYQAYESKV